jgi:hypothetical protein
VGLAIVGPFALGVGVVHDAHETRAGTRRRVLQHLVVAIRVAEREDRPLADEAVDADRLAGAVVDVLDLLLTSVMPYWSAWSSASTSGLRRNSRS